MVVHGCRKRNANMWLGRGNSGGSWPLLFPAPFSVPPTLLQEISNQYHVRNAGKVIIANMICAFAFAHFTVKYPCEEPGPIPVS